MGTLVYTELKLDAKIASLYHVTRHGLRLGYVRQERPSDIDSGWIAVPFLAAPDGRVYDSAELAAESLYPLVLTPSLLYVERARRLYGAAAPTEVQAALELAEHLSQTARRAGRG